MKNTKLVPTVITDKNGKITTVHRKEDASSSGRKDIPVAQLSPSEMLERYLEAERARDSLLQGAEGKEAIISRLKDKIEYAKEVDLYSKSTTHSLASYEIMEKLLLQEPVNQGFAKLALERHQSLDTETFLSWLKVADRHYPEIYSADEKRFLLAGFFSTVLMFNDQRVKGSLPPLTEQQERNYIMLNLAAVGSTLEGRLIREGSPWGILMALDNEDMKQFALECTDEKRVECVCEVIRNGGPKRFQEILALADQVTVRPFASGAL